MLLLKLDLIKKKDNNISGFTIIELVVAVLLLVLVFGFALQLLVFVKGQVGQWQQKNNLSQIVQRIHSSLYHDCEDKGILIEMDSVKIQIPLKNNKPIKVYSFGDEGLFREGIPMLPESVFLDSATISLQFREDRTGRDTTLSIRSDSLYIPHWQPSDTLHYSLKQFTFSGQIRSGKYTQQVHFTRNFRYHAFHPFSPAQIFGSQPDSANFPRYS